MDETPEELWAEALRQVEAEEITHEQLKLRLGVSARTLERRLARARAVRLHGLSADTYPGKSQHGPRVSVYQGPNQQGPSVTPETCEHGRRVQKGDASECLDCGTGGLDHLSDLAPFPTIPLDPSVPIPGGLAGGSESVKEPPGWKITLPDGQVLAFKARTKSDARATAKLMLKIGPKGRLPIGARVTKLN